MRKKRGNTAALQCLPVEIFRQILIHLTPLDVLRLSCASKRLDRSLRQFYWPQQDRLEMSNVKSLPQGWELCRLHHLVPAGLKYLQLTQLNSKLKDTDVVKILRKWNQLEYLAIPSLTQSRLVKCWQHLSGFHLKQLHIQGCNITLVSLNTILAAADLLENFSFTFNFQLIDGDVDDLTIPKLAQLNSLAIECVNSHVEGWKWRHIHDVIHATQLGLSFYRFFEVLFRSTVNLKSLRFSCALLNKFIVDVMVERLTHLSHLELFDSFRFHQDQLDLNPLKCLPLERVHLQDNDALIKLFLPLVEHMQMLTTLKLRINDYSLTSTLSSNFKSSSLREISLSGVITNAQVLEQIRRNCPLAQLNR